MPLKRTKITGRPARKPRPPMRYGVFECMLGGFSGEVVRFVTKRKAQMLVEDLRAQGHARANYASEQWLHENYYFPTTTDQRWGVICADYARARGFFA